MFCAFYPGKIAWVLGPGASNKRDCAWEESDRNCKCNQEERS